MKQKCLFEKKERYQQMIWKQNWGYNCIEKKGIAVSAMYNIECDYRYLYVSHNYVFYRIESEKIIIVEMFDERKDFMYKLFGISTRTQESIDYWGDED